MTRVFFPRVRKARWPKIIRETKNVLEQMKLCSWCSVMCARVHCACARDGLARRHGAEKDDRQIVNTVFAECSVCRGHELANALYIISG